MIAIADYGVGNLASIVNMFRKVGVDAQATTDPNELDGAEKLVLPGVGSFDHCVRSLTDSGLLPALERGVFAQGKPLLGICVGMQMLGKRSEEGTLAGLGWIEAESVRFDSARGLTIPHMGWTDVDVARPTPLMDADAEQRFYFLHSYHVVCSSPDDVLATATYGETFTCAVQRDHVFGVQFHPEKSHRFGMQLFERFAAAEG